MIEPFSRPFCHDAPHRSLPLYGRGQKLDCDYITTKERPTNPTGESGQTRRRSLCISARLLRKHARHKRHRQNFDEGGVTPLAENLSDPVGWLQRVYLVVWFVWLIWFLAPSFKLSENSI